MAKERFTLREDFMEQERFVENMRREREAEVNAYREDATF
jgi:hypothetical protein